MVLSSISSGPLKLGESSSSRMPEFQKMIGVRELAHLRERNHDKAFYQLGTYRELA
jgi:predicted metal-dependent hydrolase